MHLLRTKNQETSYDSFGSNDGDPYTVYTNYMKNTALPSCPQSGAGRADILMKQQSRQDALYYFAFEEVFFAEEPELLSASLPVFSTDVGSALTLSGFSPS